jgi:hypothetical protein
MPKIIIGTSDNTLPEKFKKDNPSLLITSPYYMTSPGREIIEQGIKCISLIQRPSNYAQGEKAKRCYLRSFAEIIFK